MGVCGYDDHKIPLLFEMYTHWSMGIMHDMTIPSPLRFCIERACVLNTNGMEYTFPGETMVFVFPSLLPFERSKEGRTPSLPY